MKFKLDENIGRRGLELLRSSGHDVATVWDQGLHGASDERLFDVCAAEGRVLVTLDRDFGQVPRFPPVQGGNMARRQSSLTCDFRAFLGALGYAGAGRAKMELYMLRQAPSPLGSIPPPLPPIYCPVRRDTRRLTCWSRCGAFPLSDEV